MLRRTNGEAAGIPPKSLDLQAKPPPRLVYSEARGLTTSGLLLADEGAGEELEVGGARGEAGDEVAVPVFAVRDVDAHGGALRGETELFLGTDPEEHLVLVRAGAAIRAVGERTGDRD